MWWSLTLTYIFKVIWPWLWKSCPLCSLFSSTSIISIFATYNHYHWRMCRGSGGYPRRWHRLIYLVKIDTVDPTSPWFPRSCMKTHEWTFAKVGATVHDNIFEVLIAGSLSYLYSWLPIALFYMHRGTSHIGSCWHVFSGRAGLSFREHKRRNGEICPCSCSASKAMFY